MDRKILHFLVDKGYIKKRSRDYHNWCVSARPGGIATKCEFVEISYMYPYFNNSWRSLNRLSSHAGIQLIWTYSLKMERNGTQQDKGVG